MLNQKTSFANLIFRTRFAHVISIFRVGSNFPNFIRKLQGQDQRNINATLLVDGLKINTYANTDWSGAPGVIIRPQAKKLAMFPVDIGSGGFDFRENNYDSNDPLSTYNIGRWLKSSEQLNYHNVRPKYSLAVAVEKLEEVSQRRVKSIADHNDTDYYDLNRNFIKTGSPGRYTNLEANFDGVDQIPINQEELKHNECHLNCSLADIESVFVTKEDLERSSARNQKQKVYNSREVLLYTAIKGVNLLNRKRIEAITNDVDLNYIIDFEIKKIRYLYDGKEFFNRLISEFKHNLDLLEEEDCDPTQDCEDLKIAFNNKKKKFPELFDAESKENKSIWLNANINKLEKEISNNQSEINYYQNLYQFIDNNFDNPQTKEIIKRKIIIELKKEVELVIYDKEKGRITSDFNRYGQSLQSIKDNLEDELLRFDSSKDSTFLMQLVANDFTVDEIRKFFFDNSSLNPLLKKQNLDFKNPNGLGLLHIATLNDHKEIVGFLLEKEPNLINEASEDSHTVLHLAALYGHNEMLAYLIEREPGLINKTSKYGNNALHFAVLKGHNEMVAYLIEREPSLINKANEYCYTPLHLAVKNDHQQILGLLIAYGAKIEFGIRFNSYLKRIEKYSFVIKELKEAFFNAKYKNGKLDLSDYQALQNEIVNKAISRDVFISVLCNMLLNKGSIIDKISDDVFDDLIKDVEEKYKGSLAKKLKTIKSENQIPSANPESKSVANLLSKELNCMFQAS